MTIHCSHFGWEELITQFVFFFFFLSHQKVKWAEYLSFRTLITFEIYLQYLEFGLHSWWALFWYRNSCEMVIPSSKGTIAFQGSALLTKWKLDTYVVQFEPHLSLCVLLKGESISSFIDLHPALGIAVVVGQVRTFTNCYSFERKTFSCNSLLIVWFWQKRKCLAVWCLRSNCYLCIHNLATSAALRAYLVGQHVPVLSIHFW